MRYLISDVLGTAASLLQGLSNVVHPDTIVTEEGPQGFTREVLREDHKER